MVINISFVSKGGRGLRCEWSLQCVASLVGTSCIQCFVHLSTLKTLCMHFS
ncbi:unnamed protein product [Staurois parvus]|uniref:Uncharacterized protein n=1 Tax=Staurois parvus TaxID=386267 RepID=A0ABN9D5Q8_9NEOB|nr:unnamed protein product [Staurois parvus]